MRTKNAIFCARLLLLINLLSLICSPIVQAGQMGPITPIRHPIPTFTAISVKGNININLHTGYSHSAVTVLGDPDDLKNVKITVIQGVLYLSLKNPSLHYGPISADIRTRYLNGFEYHGRGIITGENLTANLTRVVLDNEGATSLKGIIRLGYIEVLNRGYVQIAGVVGPHLIVTLENKARLQLSGKVALRHLTMKGKSWFSLAWIKSPSLILCLSDTAYAELAGIVNKFDAQLWNSAKLNAKYLRANRAFVKTHDHSVAQIAVTKHQHTFATDASDILFYNLPQMKTDFMYFDGAVLDMRAFNTPFVEEPTPYNI